MTLFVIRVLCCACQSMHNQIHKVHTADMYLPTEHSVIHARIDMHSRVSVTITRGIRVHGVWHPWCYWYSTSRYWCHICHVTWAECHEYDHCCYDLTLWCM